MTRVRNALNVTLSMIRSSHTVILNTNLSKCGADSERGRILKLCLEQKQLEEEQMKYIHLI
jgi:hypothetical protein